MSDCPTQSSFCPADLLLASRLMPAEFCGLDNTDWTQAPDHEALPNLLSLLGQEVMLLRARLALMERRYLDTPVI